MNLLQSIFMLASLCSVYVYFLNQGCPTPEQLGAAHRTGYRSWVACPAGCMLQGLHSLVKTPTACSLPAVQAVRATHCHLSPTLPLPHRRFPYFHCCHVSSMSLLCTVKAAHFQHCMGDFSSPTVVSPLHHEPIAQTPHWHCYVGRVPSAVLL